MTQVTFYQLQDDDLTAAATQLIIDQYRARQQVLVVCADQAQAEHWDEHLWQQPTDAFIPHNLRGEGPPNGAPVSIVWPPVSESRAVVVNLSSTTLAVNNRTRQVIEFVPTDETGKQAARERYKNYQRAGCQLQFQPLAKETNNG